MTTRRIAPSHDPRVIGYRAVLGAAFKSRRCDWAPREVASSGCILLQELDRIADGEDGLCRIVRDLAPELLLERHDQLDGIKTVGPKIVDEARILGDLVGLDSEVLHHDLLNALRDIAHIRLTVPAPQSKGLSSPPELAAHGPTRPRAVSYEG